MRRIVLDTSVLVSALRNRGGASYRLLEMIEDGSIIALASTTLFLEYESVLRRPAQIAMTGLDLDDIETALAAFAEIIEPVHIWYTWRPQLSDPDDEMVLETAINGHADALVTFNAADFKGAERFKIPIVTPGELLMEIRK